MRKIALILLLFIPFIKTYSQIDSSTILIRRLCGGASKTWHPGLSEIIGVPPNKPRKTFTFSLKSRTAKWTMPRGRDLPVTIKFDAWSIKKQSGDNYILTLSRSELYSVTFRKSPDNLWILTLNDVSELRNGKVGGIYFEKAPTINPSDR